MSAFSKVNELKDSVRGLQPATHSRAGHAKIKGAAGQSRATKQTFWRLALMCL